MTVTINGSTGIDKVQDGTIQSADFAAGVPARSNLPAGTVLQVVQGTTSTNTISSSSTYADTTLTATITPSSSSSKIAVFICHSECSKTNAAAGNRIRMRLVRNGSAVVQFNEDQIWNNTAQYGTGAILFNYLDSPASTSAQTYKTEFASPGGTSSVTVQSNNMTSTIILMEIAA